MPKISAEEGAQKYGRKAAASSGDWSAGVERVTESPGSAATRSRAKWEAKLNDQATRDKWARKTGAVTLDGWKRATTSKSGRYSEGVQAAVPKVADVNRELYGYIQQGEDAIARMPNVTVEDGIARSAAMIRHMANYGKGGARR